MEVKHDLSNESCASTPEEVAYMKKVSYALAVGSIIIDDLNSIVDDLSSQIEHMVPRSELELEKRRVAK
nr:hypothetical protein [Tanacetum cinerariifolium]